MSIRIKLENNRLNKLHILHLQNGSAPSTVSWQGELDKRVCPFHFCAEMIEQADLGTISITLKDGVSFHGLFSLVERRDIQYRNVLLFTFHISGKDTMLAQKENNTSEEKFVLEKNYDDIMVLNDYLVQRVIDTETGEILWERK
jgi:hypothetical protein